VTCEETRILLHALIDQELDPERASEMELHVTGCPRCAARVRDYRGMRQVLSAPGMRYQAPDSLRERIERAMPARALPATCASAPNRRSSLVAVGSVVSTALADLAAAGAPYWRKLFNGFAFGSALSAAAAAMFMFAVIGSDRDQVIVSDVVSAHLRSLQANHLTDVQASNQQGVTPWFSDRLGAAPPVPDLTSQGFNLIGGRIDYVLGRAVAALVYERDNHVINVFVARDADAERSPKFATLQGVNVELWSEKGLNLCAVGDVSAQELQDIRRKFQAAA
jgi:anti-sigma factor RsiW